MAPVGIWRIEAKRLKGKTNPTFPAGPFHRVFTRDHPVFYATPEPHRDGITGVNQDHNVFGCADLAQLDRLFGKHYSELKPHGFRISQYLVPTPFVQFGDTQAAFDHRHAVRCS